MKQEDYFQRFKDLERVEESSLDITLSEAFGEIAFAVALSDTKDSNPIYIFDLETEKSKQILSRPHCIWALGVHEGRLYDGGGELCKRGYIYDTLDDKLLVERKRSVNALVSHNGKLYDGGDYNKIIESFSGEVVAERDHNIRALESHDAGLYDGGHYKKIFDTFSNKVVAEREESISSLASHKGELYDSGHYPGIFNSFTNKKVAERFPFFSVKLTSNEELFDIEMFSLYNSLDDFKGHNTLFSCPRSVHAICAIPREVFIEFWNKGEVI